MRVAILTTDNREHHRRYELRDPYFGPAIEALLQGLATLPHLDIHVIACTQRPMNAPEKLAPNIWFHLLHVPKFGWLRTGYQGCIRAIRRKLKALQPDLVHGQGTERECGLAAAFSGFPNVITIHGNMRQVAKTLAARPGSYYWMTARLERLAVRRTQGILCNSSYTEAAVRSSNRRTWLVSNAIRRDFFAPLQLTRSANKPILLNIGAFMPYKGQRRALKICNALHRQGFEFELLFAGAADPRDPYAAACLDGIALAEKEGFARYLGELSSTELIALMDQAAGLLHLSREESFGLVIAETLARNLKLFATNIGGIPDVARNVEGAELFSPDDHDGFSRAISKWLGAGAPRPTTAAIEMARRYHPNVIAHRHADIYHETTLPNK